MNYKEKLSFFLPLLFSLIVIYYPLVFGFFISPNDIYFHYDPWRYGSFQYSSLNPTLNDPATAYWTKAYLFKTEPKSLFFNPYIGSGMPGALDLFSGILNPFVLIPIIFPMEIFFSLMVLFKILISYAGMYLFLRTFNLNPWACSFGSIIYAFFGQNVVWVFWPQTNISSLFPLFFYALRIKNRRYKFLLLFFLFIFSFTGGYPPYLLLFFYFFFLYLISTEIKFIFEKLKTVLIPLILSFLTLLPFFYITHFDLKESRRLELREKMAEKEKPFPIKSLLMFFSPYKFGTPQDFSLKINDGFYHLNFYIGIFGILSLPFGLLYIRDSRKRFFILSLILLFFILYFNSPLRYIVLKFPLVSYSSISRFSILLGFSLSAISAFGFDRILNFLKNKKYLILLPIILSIDLSFNASKFFGYQKWNKIKPEETPAISFLKENLKEKPFRVVGFYDSLWPNSSEYTKIPDIRSHFSSEGWYRNFLSMADPNVSNKMGTFLLFWDAKAINSPIFSSLFVKYLTEPPFINTIEPQILSKKYIEEPKEYIDLAQYGLKRKIHFYGIPYLIELYIKEASSKVYLNIYDEFSQNLIGRYEVLERGGKYFVTIEKPWEFNFSIVYLEIVSDGKLKIGKRDDGFCINISYSPFIKVYDGSDLKIYENRCVDEPVILTFKAREGFLASDEKIHYFSFFSREDFPEVDLFLKKSEREYKTGKVSVLDFNLYGGKFKISTSSNSILVLPFKYNKLWAEANLDGEVVKIFKVNGAMTGILIEKGEHLLTFNYGKKFLPFIFISLFIFIVFIVIFLLF